MEYTQENFNRLPGLVARKVFLDWSGYSREELAEAVKAKEIGVHRRKGHRRGKYYKADLAKLTKFKI